MCCISGIISNKSINNNQRLEDSLNIQKHRGPDSSGIWWNNARTVGFGHCRLSIIELTKLGHQPMISIDEFAITFNGEIYNFRELRMELLSLGQIFFSHSDTEVILNAYKVWGEECVNKFNGMFVFAIYDPVNNKIFFARDRVGEKPLYFSVNDHEFIFSSELKGIFPLLKNHLVIDKYSFNHYLTNGYVNGNNSIISNVSKLKPGHTLTVELSNLDYDIKKYWEPPHFNYSKNISNEKLVDELELLLNDSIRLQTMADVEVGVLLSGGVDSSIVTSIASKLIKNISTFTVSFPGNSEYDEVKFAKNISNYFGTKHTVLNAEDITPLFFTEISEKIDEPIMDTSFLPTYLLSNLISKHCKVALGGDGADELFGGYKHYPNILKQEKIANYVPLLGRERISSFFSSYTRNGLKGRNWITSFENDFNKFIPNVALYYNNEDRKKILNKDYYIDYIHSKSLMYKNYNNSNDTIYSSTRSDFENYLPEDILVKVDRASMLNSLEIRAPFLDFRIVEFAFRSVPSDFKVLKNQKKVILQELSKRILPPDYNANRKQGFSIPIEKWLNDKKWLNYIKDILLDENQLFFNQVYLEKLLKNDITKKSGESILGLVMFELWSKKNKIK
jgi:asparagine synthase (glutamine-hydrolysing)